MFGLPRLYLYLALAAMFAVALGGSYMRGRSDGRAAEAVTWQRKEIDRQQQEAIAREELQHALDARNAEITQRQQDAANAVVQIRTEFLPGKTIVKREVVEKPVYRDCVIDDSMFNVLNAALRGAPIADDAVTSSPYGLSRTIAFAPR